MSEPRAPAQEHATFREVQRFRQPLLLLVIAAVAAPFWYLVVAHFVFGAAVEASGELVVVVWVLAGVLLPALLVAARLVTEVAPRGLRLRFPPFVTREVPFAEIRRVQPPTYRPLREYGGWGIRWGRGGKRAYNVSGREGVEVELTDGRTVIVGSQRPDELAEAIRAYLGR